MTRLPVTFRRATIKDLPGIMEIETLSLGRWQWEFFETEFRNSFSFIIIALTGEEIAGFAVVWNIAGEAQLNNIAVRPELRRNGIGRALIERIPMECAKVKPAKILIEVNERNERARQFYINLGFFETGVRPKYYDDDDAILMEKKL